MDVEGRTILITGASRGIGAATARHLAAQGARVALMARDADALHALAEETGGVALPGDVSDWETVAGAVETLGEVHGLMNNAGLIDPIARIEDSDPAAWARVVNVNLTGAYNALRAVLPGMRARGEGVVVNISSGAATGALEGWSHYCATKAALLSLTRCAQKELEGTGVHVVGLSPGTVATDMQRAIKASGINPVSQLDWDRHIPAQDVAKAVAWLFAEGAPRHAGGDFSLKTPEGRAEAGLAPL